MSDHHHDQEHPNEQRLTPNRKYGMGHIPPKEWLGATSVRRLIGAGSTHYPSSFMSPLLDGMIDRIRPQGQSNSCVGKANARVLHVRGQLLLADHPERFALEYPSELAIYDMAREEDPYAPGELQDMGSDPALAIEAMQKRGVLPERLLPFPELTSENGDPVDPDAFRRRLPFDLLNFASQYKVTGVGVLDGDDTAQVERDAKVLLSSRQPFCVALDVDEQFEEYDDHKPLGPVEGKTFGGHDLAIVGYEPEWAWGVNSWPGDWGQKGLFRMSWSRLAQCRARYYPQTVPIFPNNAPNGAQRRIA